MSLKEQNQVIKDFQVSEFEAPRGLFSFITANCHWQTIVGSEAIRTWYFRLVRPFNTTSERFNTPDDDFFDVEYTSGFEENDRVVIVVHGLESDIRGPLVTKMANAFLNQGFDCCLLSHRGCNGFDNNAPGAYHMGFTDDLHQLVKEIHRRYPAKRIYVSGFSLGGNVALKFLGEISDRATNLGVCGGVATCVPFTLKENQKKLDRGFNRAVYSEVW